MIEEEAYKTLGVSAHTTKENINRIYLQRREYFKKQLEDLENLPHLIRQKEKFNLEFKSLNEAFITLGGVIDGLDKQKPKTFKENLVNSIEKVNTSIDGWRDQILNSLKRVPGILFFTLIIILLAVLLNIIF